MIPCSGFIEEVQNVRTSTKGTIQHKEKVLSVDADADADADAGRIVLA